MPINSDVVVIHYVDVDAIYDTIDDLVVTVDPSDLLSTLSRFGSDIHHSNRPTSSITLDFFITQMVPSKPSSHIKL